MKKTITALIAAVFVLFLANSFLSSWNVQRAIFTNEGNQSPNIGQTSDTEEFRNSKNGEENAVSSVTKTDEAKTCEDVALSGHSEQSQLETDQAAVVDPGHSGTHPDGAIYYGGEPPYAYIPTFDPREPNIIRIPNVPPELDN